MKKFISTVAILCLTIGYTVNAGAAPSQWAETAVSYMAEHKLADSVKDYQTDITRGDFTKLLMNVFEEATQNKSQPSDGVFEDIRGTANESKIVKAVREGLVNGVSEKSFAPDGYLTREQAAVMIKNLALRLYPGYEFETGLRTFSDQGQISQWALDGVGFCVSNGFMNGVSTTEFSPKSRLTHEQAVSILYNFAMKVDLVEKGTNSSQRNKNYDRGYDFATTDSGYVYLSLLESENTQQYLYSMDTSAAKGDPKRFINEEISGFEVTGGKIFTIQRAPSGNSQIVSYDQGAPSSGVVLAEGVVFTGFDIDGDWIYFSDMRNVISRMRLDGTCRSDIYHAAGTVRNLKVTDGMVYFSHGGDSFMRVSIDGVKAEKILDKVPVMYLVYGNNAYMLFERQERLALEAAYDLYLCDMSRGGASKILDRVQRVYSNADGVYAYRAEPSFDENKLFKINGSGNQEIRGTALNLLLKNNAKNLYFSDDGKLYYSVMKPVNIKDMVDIQTYMYTNTVNLKSGESAGLYGGPPEIHSYQELEDVYNKLPYRVSEKAGAKDKELIEKAKAIVGTLIKPGMSDYEKEKTIHDYIVLNCAAYDDNELRIASYSYTRLQNWYNPIYLYELKNDIYTPYGVLINKMALCEGYALAAKLLLNMAGVETYFIVGGILINGEVSSHGWNIVKIDGNYYHLDAIANDPTPDVIGGVRYNYFNLTDDEIGVDHIAADRDKYPPCVTKWNN